jgi:hypothetical protein
MGVFKEHSVFARLEQLEIIIRYLQEEEIINGNTTRFQQVW